MYVGRWCRGSEKGGGSKGKAKHSGESLEKSLKKRL